MAKIIHKSRPRPADKRTTRWESVMVSIVTEMAKWSECQYLTFYLLQIYYTTPGDSQARRVGQLLQSSSARNKNLAYLSKSFQNGLEFQNELQLFLGVVNRGPLAAKNNVDIFEKNVALHLNGKTIFRMFDITDAKDPKLSNETGGPPITSRWPSTVFRSCIRGVCCYY